ncbi:hypothetical protein [Mucilaginibacter arboris]|uniref:DUF3352 domain-containing protein n=1 Tax=Mucilaginibacter arboris TaxID=2682090 RepID=A0A7K1SXH2_9SPHI|nr:hypothetical protein [Mucilaginibacter arboris]MVN21948.1 hypothetical protein [Mucilaginibacter arboris]
MRKIILITVFLFLTALTVTIFYFSRIKLPGQNTTHVIDQIPQDAALVFEFKNDPQFYDLFKESSLLTSFIGQKKADELQYLHNYLLKQSAPNLSFGNQSIFISLHPEINSSTIEMLLTTSADGIINLQKALEAMVQKTDGAIEPERIGNKSIQKITFPALKEAFYLSINANVLAGSFSKDLLLEFLDERTENKVSDLTQLSEQQNKNSIADLYVNYKQFPVLFKQLFRHGQDDFFRFLNDFPASSALSLNYKKDALLFNGYTKTDTAAATYIHVFLNQQPVKNTIQSVFPINTALAVSFAYGNTATYLKALDQWQSRLHQNKQAKALFKQIRQETGVAIQTAFRQQLGNEFAIITTAENEKIAIIKVKNGSELEPFLRNISVNPDSSRSNLKYQNVPYYLLGEPFLHFKQPYFTVIDNYLLLANTQAAIDNYLQNYHNQHFLNEDQQYYAFNTLLAEQSNVSFFVHLPNSYPLLKNMLQPEFSKTFNQKNSGWKNYFAVALQFTASESNFYTNFYLQQNEIKRDSSAL